MSREHLTKGRRYALISKVFTPAAPVSSRDLFAGRADEIMRVINVLTEPGLHVALYGERGVGKTSLANVLSDFVTPHDGGFTGLSVRINCNTQDKFKSIWTKALRELGLDVPDNWALGSPDPDEIRYLISRVLPQRLIIFDEFDRIEDDDTLTLIADTLKALSDHQVESKLVIVGVADSIDQLVGEHESIQRALAEIHLPRMEESDSRKIIASGLNKLGMRISSAAETRIVRLAEGLPHYVHLLSQKSAQRVLSDDREEILTSDVDVAITDATQRHTLVREYQTAIQSPRPDNLYSRVLAACALAEKNLLGQFTSSAVRTPMSAIMGKRYDIPAFARHLADFSEAEHGFVLKREGTPRKYTYRFRNPLLQPFAIMAALADGFIPEEYQRELFDK